MKEKIKKIIKKIDWSDILSYVIVWSIVALLAIGFIWIMFFNGLQYYPSSGSSNPEDCIPNYMGGCDL